MYRVFTGERERERERERLVTKIIFQKGSCQRKIFVKAARKLLSLAISCYVVTIIIGHNSWVSQGSK